MSQHEISPENQAIVESLEALIARAEKEINDLDNVRKARKQQIREWRRMIRIASPKPKKEKKAA
jgi:hypothetical protein